MSLIANILWILFGGVEMALFWVMAGLICFISIIGIPLGFQCFKMAQLSFMPFGTHVSYGGGVGSFLLNVLWLLIGIPAACAYAFIGCCWCLTIVGIPVGLQSFKMAKLSLAPFGTEVA